MTEAELQASVVLITSADDGNHSFGTGFVIHREGSSTFLLTCAHVVTDVGGPGKVQIGGLPTIAVGMVAYDENNLRDLAVLRVEGLAANPPPLLLALPGDSGSEVHTAGFQEFDANTRRLSPLHGKLGTLGAWERGANPQRVSVWEVGIEGLKTLQPGYSGSPLVDRDRRCVVGVISHQFGEGKEGLAISIENLAAVWPGLPPELRNQIVPPLPPLRGGVPPPRPYPGLQAYDEETYAPYFHGRDEEIQRLIVDLGHRSFVLILGPSGAGKTSLLFGGLLPRIKQAAWQVERMHPGLSPADKLDFLISGARAEPKQAVHDYLRAYPSGTRLLLVVDQFEECFTQATGDEQRDFFTALNVLRTLPQHCAVVLAMRDDFQRDLQSSPLGPIKEGDWLPIMPLKNEQLKEAIRQPAAKVGVQVEEGLVVQLMSDAADEPGRLPRLQAALEILWNAVENGALPLTAYQRLRGGLAQAVARKANNTLGNLTRPQRDIARRIFLRLIQFIEGRADTRRQQHMSALRAHGENTAAVNGTLDALIESGLLTVSLDESRNDDPFIDLAHEALITDWPRLQQWLDEWRTAEQDRRRYEDRAVDWARAGRGAGYTLDPIALAEAEAWLRSPSAEALGYSADLVGLVEASRREAAKRETTDQRVRAAAIAARATEQEQHDPELALLLAIEAVQATWGLGHSPLPQAEEALRTVLTRRPVHRVLRGHEDEVLCAAYSSDAKHVVTGGKDSVARIWAVDSGQEVQALRGHDGWVTGVAWSRDGKYVITASADATARIWDAASGEEHSVLRGHQSTINSVAFSPNGRFAATGTMGGSVWFWSLEDSAPSAKTEGHRGPVHSVAYSPDGKSLVSAGDDGVAKIWTAPSGKEVATLRGHVNAVWGAAWSPDAKKILTAGEDRTAILWDAARHHSLYTFGGQSDPVRVALFSPDGASILTASGNGVAHLWDAGNWQRDVELRIPSAVLRSAAYSPDRQFLVVVGGDNQARLLSTAWGLEHAILRTSAYRLHSGAYSPDGQFIVIASSGAFSVNRSNYAQVWNRKTGQVEMTLNDLGGGVTYAEYSPDGRFIVTASDDYTAKIWDTRSPKEPRKLKGHTGALNQATYRSDGKTIVTASDDQTAIIWDAATAHEMGTLEGHEGKVTCAVYAPGGTSRIVTTSRDGTARVWDATTCKEMIRFSGHAAEVNGAAWSPDGRFVVTVGKDQSARIWEAGDGRERAALHGHAGAVLSVAWSPNGRTIVTGGADNAVRLWDAETAQPRCILRGHTAEVVSVAFSRDAERIITISSGNTWVKTVREYLVDVDALLSLAAARVNRSLTPEERATFLSAEHA